MKDYQDLIRNLWVFQCPPDVLVSADNLMSVPVFQKNSTICVNLRAAISIAELEFCLLSLGGLYVTALNLDKYGCSTEATGSDRWLVVTR